MARLALTFIATVILLALPVAGHRQTTPSTDDALGRFHRAINAYMDLHRRAERSVLALQPTADWTAIARTLEARAAAIRAARPAAAAGDLFDSQASDTIRGRIRAVLRQRGDGLPELEDTDEEIASGTARPAVNGRFPWARGAMMPPDILHALPPLPEELQYRVVDRDLVLIDMHADLVVDILPDALPDPASDTWR